MDLVPKKKPEKSKTDADYKKRINSLLIGFYGTGPEYRGLAVDEIQKTLDEAEQKGVLSKQDGLSFVQERKKHYDSYFADRAQKQRLRGVIEEGLSTVERPEFELGGSTDYRAMVTRMYIEAGGQEGTGMDIESFAAAYFPKMANGGRIGFDKGTPKDFNRNPGGKNQFTANMKSIEQIKQIQKANPTFRPKDLRGEGTLNNPKMGDNFKGKLLTRDDIKRAQAAGVVFPTGKIKFKDSRGDQNLKASQFYKSTQGGAISMDKINNFAHYAPKLLSYLTSTADTGPLKASVNRAAEGYDKKAIVIAKEQERLINEKPKNYKKLLVAENAKAKKASIEANKQLTKADKNLKGTLGYFTVNPDTGKFTLKGVDRAKTFAGISGEKREYIKMNPSDRVAFGPTQSKVQSLIDLVKSKVKDSNPMRASNAPIPNKTKLNNLFKNFKIRIPGGSAGDIKDPLGGPDLIDIKKVLRND